MFGRLLRWYTVYAFLGLLPPDGILLGVKFILRQSLAFFCIGSVTAPHSSSGRQPDFPAWYKEWNYGTFAQGTAYIWLSDHHVGHRLTFLWLPYVIGQAIIFLPCGFYLLSSSFFPRLISAATD